MSKGAYYTGNYPNLFAEIGISQEQIAEKIQDTFQRIFFDPNERFYFEKGPDKGYILDTGNNDVRTEGMSYGMMMAVQMDRQDIFDRLWLFSRIYMYLNTGKHQGYFAWTVRTDGIRNAAGPAPDGEEYFAMALFFASRRWGDKEEPFDYSIQAREILRRCIHQPELVAGGKPMWDSSNYLIKFIPDMPFTDPSYHLPNFYALFALMADEQDRPFWQKAAAASRQYLHICCDQNTGMAPEHAEYDGTPKKLLWRNCCRFYSDSYRVAMNIGLDAAWFNEDEALGEIVDKLQAYFSEKTTLGEYYAYTIEGAPLDEPAMHPVAIIATNAAGSLAAKGKYRLQWVKDFWELPLRQGERRYYDNCLYFFSLLMLAGQYKIY